MAITIRIINDCNKKKRIILFISNTINIEFQITIKIVDWPSAFCCFLRMSTFIGVLYENLSTVQLYLWISYISHLQTQNLISFSIIIYYLLYFLNLNVGWPSILPMDCIHAFFHCSSVPLLSPFCLLGSASYALKTEFCLLIIKLVNGHCYWEMGHYFCADLYIDWAPNND